MSQYKRKPSPAKKIAILTFYWFLELLPFFVFWTNPALTNTLNGVEKAAWLLWEKLQAELRWPLATFPVRVTSATVCSAGFFFGGGGMNLHLSRADPLPPPLYLCSVSFFQKHLWFSFCFWSPSSRRDENSEFLLLQQDSTISLFIQ